MLDVDRDEAHVPDEEGRRLLASAWGIFWPDWPSWPWTTKVRILVVIDGRITPNSYPWEFGLGYVLETMRDISFAWWVKFIVRVVDRDEGFRFTEDGFDLDIYDQVWFFGDWPGIVANNSSVGDDIIKNPEYFPMEPGELQVIATWMNKGGGVFAAGDHAMLGASMCHEIPRVRSMRKWTRADGVPSFGGADRHETLRRESTGGELDWEEDATPQRIYPAYRVDWRKPFLFRRWPHPLLCGKDGVIDRFPDHMHEGAVVEDDDVLLTDPLLPGSSEDEYPPYRVVVAPTAMAGPVGGSQLELRPRPEVIAYGMVTHIEAAPIRFPLLGVYDGEPADVGRVVVDSTWHHWFTMNLEGLRNGAPSVYRNMQSYYRNVGLWLASPAKRASMAIWSTWGVLVGSQPGAFGPELGVWGLGARVVDVLGRTAPQCIVSELVAPLIPERVVTAKAQGAPAPWEASLRPQATLITEAIVGGIAMGMLGLASHHITERAYGRSPKISPEDIWSSGLDGLRVGARELQAALADVADGFSTLQLERFEERFVAVSEMPADVGADANAS